MASVKLNYQDNMMITRQVLFWFMKFIFLFQYQIGKRGSKHFGFVFLGDANNSLYDTHKFIDLYILRILPISWCFEDMPLHKVS